MSTTVDDVLSLLDEMNEQGRIEYADYSQLHDAIATTLGNANRVYVLRGTDPNAMPSCGSETNELLGIYATHEAAEKAKAEWHGYCELNITEWEVVKR